MSAVVAALALGLGAALVIVFASNPEPESPVALTDLTPASPVTSTTAAQSVTTTASSVTNPPEPILADLLPDTQGTLVTAVGQGGVELIDWPADGPRHSQVIPMHTGPFLEFDVSGQYLAFLGTSAFSDARTLYVGTLGVWAPAAAASSHQWHATDPGEIAWIDSSDDPELCSASIEPDRWLSTASCVDGAGVLLVGFDDKGFLTFDNGSIVRVSTSGEIVARVPGSDALVGPDGRVLIVDQDPETYEASFSLADPDLSDVVSLDWAPADTTGEYGFVAWSPVANPPQLAFLVYLGEEGWQLQRWTLDGENLTALNLRGRFWNVGWDSTGRYLLVPGVTESESVVVVYDLVTREHVFIPFNGWIQDVELLTPAVCEDAEHLVEAFEARVRDDVGVEDLQMVLSRNFNSESWYFISGRLAGGPFDDQLATWAAPGFDGENVADTGPPLPINEAAAHPGTGRSALDPADYGVDSFMQLDGARTSQWCVEQTG